MAKRENLHLFLMHSLPFVLCVFSFHFIFNGMNLLHKMFCTINFWFFFGGLGNIFYICATSTSERSSNLWIPKSNLQYNEIGWKMISYLPRQPTELDERIAIDLAIFLPDTSISWKTLLIGLIAIGSLDGICDSFISCRCDVYKIQCEYMHCASWLLSRHCIDRSQASHTHTHTSSNQWLFVGAAAFNPIK